MAQGSSLNGKEIKEEEILEYQEERTMKRVQISVNNTDFCLFLSFVIWSKSYNTVLCESLYTEEIFVTITFINQRK